ncbi:hypothetical protein GCM10007978_06640 [Shewanella hanedai]|uniref:Polysaccharide pyruvyl transferase family protein n=1 Tax=Shewanella hanedai TaxID=25 RepID=A0A553JTA5_SHEHA|nr:polysaccharide pyruvyl transferase family protein [Shewanella hanedai]TRY15688.1 polysaccharide pyruvyl transferase family protein [Shewanella hanedai]GGI71357.1 hypothetical protein GCM10007978_06640 [Shewanella hanedai]
MKIGLLTIHNALNYGAVFQAYATQEVLSRHGKTEIINYKNSHIEKVYSIFNVKPNSKILRHLVRDLLLLKSKVTKKVKFNCFFDDYFNLSEEYNFNNISSSKYDLYVCGSDQIWNPKVTNGCDIINEDYFLGFIPTGVKKISYASSLGNYRFDIKQEKQVKYLLGTFDYISVREKDGTDYLESILGGRVKQVLDPTLLLSKEEWIGKLNLRQKHDIEEYILVYTVPRSSLLKDVVDFYSKTGIKIIAVDSNLIKIAGVDEQVRDAGPQELLNLILNAKMVLTDSFHGVCFAINFKKDFAAISSGTLSNRMKNILSLVGMEDRFIESLNDIRALEPINDEVYLKSLLLLEEHKKISIDYLKKALSN